MASTGLAPWREGVMLPAGVMAYIGRLEGTNLLVSVGGGHRLAQDPAAGYQRMVAAAQRAGFQPRLTDSYRSTKQQEASFRQRYAQVPKGTAGAKQWNGAWWKLKPGNAQLATPGQSVHNAGYAIDIFDARGGKHNEQLHAWLKQNAGQFGWAGTVKSEPWHYVFQGPNAGKGYTAWSGPNTNTTTPSGGAGNMDPAAFAELMAQLSQASSAGSRNERVPLDQPARDYLGRMRIEMQKDQSVTPALLAYFRASGQQLAQAEDTRDLQLGQVASDEYAGVERINRSADQERRSVTGDVAARGMFRSGEAARRYGEQRASQQQRIGDVTRAAAGRRAAIDLAFGQAEETMRNQTLERMLATETQVQTDKAEDEARQRQQQALVDFYTKIARQGVV